MENCALRGKLTVRSGMRILGEGDYDYPAPRLCPSSPLLCPISHSLLSPQGTEENAQEREFMIFSFFHMPYQREK